LQFSFAKEPYKRDDILRLSRRKRKREKDIERDNVCVRAHTLSLSRFHSVAFLLHRIALASCSSSLFLTRASARAHTHTHTHSLSIFLSRYLFLSLFLHLSLSFSLSIYSSLSIFFSLYFFVSLDLFLLHCFGV